MPNMLGTAVTAGRAAFSTASKTTAVRSAHALDTQALCKYLASALPQFEWSESALRLRQFSHGQSNPTYTLETANGETLVLRKQPPGKILRGAHAVDREATVMKALHGVVPVPNVVHFESNAEVIGTPFFLYRYVDGMHVPDSEAASLDATQRASAFRSMADTLATLHSVDPSAVGLEGFGSKPEQFMGRQVKVWSAQYRASETHTIPAMESLLEYLPTVVPGGYVDDGSGPPQGHSVVHGDYRLDNLVLDASGTRVEAVLDWELATLGHPLLDLAHNCLPYYLPHSTTAPLSGYTRNASGHVAVPGVPSEDAYLAQYLEGISSHSASAMGCPARLGIAVDPNSGAPAHWPYYVAVACFRAASILQGVFKRSQMGNASAENAAAAGALTEQVAQLGWQQASLYKASAQPQVVKPPATSTDSGSSTVYTFGKKTRCPPPADAGDAAVSAAAATGSQDTPPAWPIPIFAPPSPRAQRMYAATKEFLHEEILPLEHDILGHAYENLRAGDAKEPHAAVEELKGKARAAGLWNMFLPPHALDRVQVEFSMLSEPEQRRLGLGPAAASSACVAPGLTNAEYAPIAELTGYSLVAPEVFNCSAPDTGNMEVLAMYGSPQQQHQWLMPLLTGEIRSCFGMTEPAVASSDATNMEATVVQQEDGTLLLNGHKWWTSGACDPRTEVMIFMARSTAAVAAGAPAHAQHSMVLVPLDTPGVTVGSPLRVLGYDDAPHGHAEVTLENVVVPAENMILGDGRGFQIAQGRLGPGRIHHCMRLVGMAERGMAEAGARVQQRHAFGSVLAAKGAVRQKLAESRCDVEQARLLTLSAAHAMDTVGAKNARSLIAQIKVVAPRMACHVLDECMQQHGGMGVSQHTPLAHMYAWARALRLADGPDEVHLETIAKQELRTAEQR